MELATPIRVLVVGAWEGFGDLLEELLANDEHLEVVGSARDGREALGLAVWLSPDIVLVDLDAPGTDGFEATRRLRSLLPNASVLLLSATTSTEGSAQAIAAGAAGYLTKERMAAELVGSAYEAAASRGDRWKPRARLVRRRPA
jgi:DNA-binding NarL/FixJ family response regulator